MHWAPVSSGEMLAVLLPTHFSQVYRLRGGVFPWMGRVEVRSGSSAWATVCRTGWDFAEANIVCRALGYGKAKLPYASHGRGVGSILYSSLGCVCVPTVMSLFLL